MRKVHDDPECQHPHGSGARGRFRAEKSGERSAAKSAAVAAQVRLLALAHGDRQDLHGHLSMWHAFGGQTARVQGVVADT
jgi:hypothetical protein